MGSQMHKTRFRFARWLALLGLLLALTPVWTATAQTGGVATITITAVADDGTPLPFSRFQIVDSNGELLTTRETLPPDGTVSIPIELTDPALTYTVTMETPPACAIMPPDEVVGPFNDGDEVALTFTTSFDPGCELGSVSLYHYTCPDELDASGDDYALYRDNCVEADNGVSFTLAEAQEGGQSFPMTTGAYGIDGRVPLVGLAPGDYTVTLEDGDSDQTLAYCLTFSGTPVEAFEPSAVSREGFDGDTIAIALDPRDRIACDFFAVSGAPSSDEADSSDDDEVVEDDEPVENENEGDDGAEGAGVANASIEFHVATCPEGYDDTDYFNDCGGNGTDEVGFTVFGQGTGYSASERSDVPVSPGFGIAVISGLPADTYTMTDDYPSDFFTTWVYCADVPGGGPRIPTPDIGGQQFDIELAAGQQVICDWFITPEAQQAEPAILRLTLFTCESGYGGSSFADFTSDCTDPTEDVFFNLSNGSGYDVDDDTNDEGRIRFTGLPPDGDYLLVEDVPGEFLENRVAFCATNDGDYIEYEAVDNGEIDLDPIASGDEVQCLWYNVPVDQNVGDGSVEIHKSECPAGTTSDFYDVCHDDPVGGIGFELDGPGSVNDLGNSNDDGILVFSELPPGDYVISEIAPADYDVAVYVVHCTRDGAAFPTEYDDNDGLRIEFELPAGAAIVCDWYNIPRGPAPTPIPTAAPAGDDDDDEAGSITVIKANCEDEAEDIRDFAAECDMPGAGVEFELSERSGSESWTGETGANGRLVFGGLESGKYDLDEVDGAWCKAQADRVDASGNVIVQDGANTNVYIYNCGVDNVTVLPSTGTGPGLRVKGEGLRE